MLTLPTLPRGSSLCNCLTRLHTYVRTTFQGYHLTGSSRRGAWPKGATIEASLAVHNGCAVRCVQCDEQGASTAGARSISLSYPRAANVRLEIYNGNAACNARSHLGDCGRYTTSPQTNDHRSHGNSFSPCNCAVSTLCEAFRLVEQYPCMTTCFLRIEIEKCLPSPPCPCVYAYQRPDSILTQHMT